MARGKKAAAGATGPTEGPGELPEGWRWRRLSDAMPLEYGKALSAKERDAKGGVPVFGSSGQVGRHSEALTTGPTVVVGRKGSAGSVYYSTSPCWPIDTAFFVAPADDVDLRYGYRLLQHLRLDQLDQSTAIPSLSRDTYSDIVGPFPAREVQRQIAARIDQIFDEIDEGKAALADAHTATETYRQALLKAAVTGELTADWRSRNPQAETGQALLTRILAERRSRWEADPKHARKRYVEPEGPGVENLPQLPDTWAWASLPMLGDFGRGKSKHRPRNDPRLYGGPYPFIQTGVVAASGGEIDTSTQTYSELGLTQSKLWPKGTVCITIAANIAKSGILGFDACFPDSIVGLTCMDGVSPRYIDLFIRSVQANLEAYAPATAQKNINLETLNGVAVPLPSLAEQEEIVRLARGDSGVRAVEDEEAWRAVIADLRQSILASAFRGELNTESST